MSLSSSEHELVEQAICGDRLALERLLLFHGSRLARYLEPRIPSILNGVIDVDDIMQQTFLQVYRDIGSFQSRGQGSFFAWIRGIADNRLFDCIREHKRKKRGGEYKRQRVICQASSVIDILDAFAGKNGTPSQSIARREAIRAVQIGVAGLQDDQREAIRRHWMEGQSLEETAESMGKTVGAVRALIYRGKCKLQEQMDRSAIWIKNKD